MNYLYLDTNIFIHFKSFEDIPWNQLLNVKKENIEIVIAPIVIDELDKHKYNSNQKIAGRIKKLMPKFHEILSSGNSKGLKVRFVNERPNIQIFNDYLLDRTQQDDCLLACIIGFKNELDTNDKVFYITNDFGPIIKAKSLSIDILPVPEEYLMEDDLSEEQKLKKENERLKNLFPKIDFYFKDSHTIIYEVEKKDFNINKELVIQDKMLAITKEFPKLTYVDYSDGIDRLKNLSLQQVTNYNRDLDTFYISLENYWEILCDSLVYKENFLKLNLVLENIGNMPAKDIDVVLDFPVETNILLKEDLDYFHIIEPDPPYKPTSSFDVYYSILNNYYPAKSSISKKKPVSRNTIEFNFHDLKHNKCIELDTLYIALDKISKGFKIKYSILISNVPNPIKGELNVKLIEV